MKFVRMGWDNKKCTIFYLEKRRFLMMFLLSKMLWLSLAYSANEKEDQHSRKALLRGSRIDKRRRRHLRAQFNCAIHLER